MSHVHLAWELGGGYGHLSRLSALAGAFSEHRLSFTVHDLDLAERYLGGYMDSIHQSPMRKAQVRPKGGLPRNLTEIISNVCFGDDGMDARCYAWRNQLAGLAPDAVVADHSPSALLAAHTLGIPVVSTGTGFSVPPSASPMPLLRDWEAAEPGSLEQREAVVLERVNRFVERVGGEPLERLSDLYGRGRELITSYPELDHHGARDEGCYVGVWPSDGGEPIRWPEGDGRKVFAYLKPFKALPATLKAMKDSGASVVVHMRGAPKKARERFEGGNLRFMDQPADLRQAGAEADLAVLNGGHATVAQMLHTGTPILIVPMHLEQVKMGQRLEALGAALSARMLRPKGIRNKLGRLLAENTFSEAASSFATSHDAPTRESFEAGAAARLNSLLG